MHGDVGGVGIDVLGGPARGLLAVPDALDGLDGVHHAAVPAEGSEVARLFGGGEHVHQFLVGVGARNGGRGALPAIDADALRPYPSMASASAAVT